MTQAALRVVGKEDNSDRKRALEAALSQIDRAFGKGSVMKLGGRDLGLATDAVSTGSLGLDIELGIGGLPRGRVIEIYGPESSGKTTLALHVVAEAQKKGGIAAYIDAEHALDPVYAKKLGVDIDEMLISQPDTGEQALEITDTLVRSCGVEIVPSGDLIQLFEACWDDEQWQMHLEAAKHTRSAFDAAFERCLQRFV